MELKKQNPVFDEIEKEKSTLRTFWLVNVKKQNDELKSEKKISCSLVKMLHSYMYGFIIECNACDLRINLKRDYAFFLVAYCISCDRCFSHYVYHDKLEREKSKKTMEHSNNGHKLEFYEFEF